MPVTHTFSSPKADGADATLVRPSNWNAAHTIDDILLSKGTIAGANAGHLGLKTTDGPTGYVGIQGTSWNVLGLWAPGATLSGSPQFGISTGSILLGLPVSEYSQPIRLNPRGDVTRGILVTSGGNIPILDTVLFVGQTQPFQRWLASNGSTVLASLASEGTLVASRLRANVANGLVNPSVTGYLPGSPAVFGDGTPGDDIAMLGGDLYNRLRGADSGRYTVTSTNMGGNIGGLFDGQYESNAQVATGVTGDVTIDFNPQMGWTANVPSGFTYGQGWIVITFYYTDIAQNVKVEAYRQDGGGAGVDGWSDVINITNNTRNQVFIPMTGWNYIKRLRVTVSHPSHQVQMSEIEYYPFRPAEVASNLYIPRYGGATLYGTLNWNGDTNLYRSAANELKTDDALVVAGIIKQSTTKTVLDTDHTAAADPHTVYILDSLLTGKGSIITASAASTPVVLTVGADDTILMADAAAGGGLKWVASATPSTQAFGDAAAVGTADTFTRGDHKHAMPADPVTNHAAAADPHTGYVLESAINAKGDLYVGTADNTPGILTVGANDTILMADSAAGTGVKWVASQTPVTQAYSDTAAEGTADTYARGDHKHGMPASGSFSGDVAGAFALQGDITINITANMNDWAPAGLAGASVIRLTSDAARTVTGLTGGVDGRTIILYIAQATSPITLAHDSASSTAANRFYCPSEADFVMTSDGGVVLIYDATISRWRAISTVSYSATAPVAVGTAAVGTAAALARSNHVHPTGAGTPSTQAFGDAAAVGTGPAASMTDHKHAMPADPTTAHAAAADPHTGYRLESADHTHASTGIQAGTIAHSALTGLTNDEHTQYVLEATAGITGTLALSADITDTSVGTQNDWAPTGIGTATVIRWNGASSITLSGITGGADGRVLVLMNVTSGMSITLRHDLTSTAANRFYLPDSLDNFFIPARCGVTLLYDATLSRWLISGHSTFELSNSTPAIESATGSPGTSPTASRRDHVHPSVFQSIDFSKGGTLAVGVGTFRWYNRSGVTLTFDSVTASVGTAPTGASIIIDVNKGGTTIYTTQANRPTIAVSTNTHDDTTAPNITTVADNEYLTIDIDQVGSTVAGADLTVQVWLRT